MFRGRYKNAFIYLFPLLFSGCISHYKVGYPIDRTSIKTIYVAPAIQKAVVPQMSAVLSRQIREEVLRTGGIKLADRNLADAELETTITDYGRSIGSVDEYDTNTARTLSLNATICCSLKKSDGTYLFKDYSVSSSININANTSAQALEYQRLPQLTRELAKKVVMRIINIDLSSEE